MTYRDVRFCRWQVDDKGMAIRRVLIGDGSEFRLILDWQMLTSLTIQWNEKYQTTLSI